MADIIALPCAANQPVVQERRRGRLPNRYPSIPRILREREWHEYREEQRQAEADRQRQKEERHEISRELDACPNKSRLELRWNGDVWDAHVRGPASWQEAFEQIWKLADQLEEDFGFKRRAPIVRMEPLRAISGGRQ